MVRVCKGDSTDGMREVRNGPFEDVCIDQGRMDSKGESSGRTVGLEIQRNHRKSE